MFIILIIIIIIIIIPSKQAFTVLTWIPTFWEK